MNRRWRTRPLLMLAWLYVLVEFVVYDVLQALSLRLTRHLPLRSFEVWAQRRGIWASVGLLALPTLLLVPIKFLEVWLFFNHHYLSGVLALIGAKLVGTAFVAYLFSLTKPVLMTAPRFARFYDWVMLWRERVLDPVLQSRAYRRMRVLRRWLKSRWSAWRGGARQRWLGRALSRLRYSRQAV